MPPGLFIALDGLDGAGKSTQCRLLAQWLREQGRSVVEAIDPGGTALGGELRKLLLTYRGQMALSCEALLFMASRAQLVAEVIRPALAAGQVVVADRFVLANVVYQGHAGGLDPAELWALGGFSAGGLEPDLTFVFDLPLEVAQARRAGALDRLESRSADYQRRVREGFRLESKRRPDRFRIVDASQSVEAVQARLRQEVAPLLER